jgi:hypothetical protein
MLGPRCSQGASFGLGSFRQPGFSLSPSYLPPALLPSQIWVRAASSQPSKRRVDLKKRRDGQQHIICTWPTGCSPSRFDLQVPRPVRRYEPDRPFGPFCDPHLHFGAGEPPTAAQPKTGQIATPDQTVHRGVTATQILGGFPQRHDRARSSLPALPPVLVLAFASGGAQGLLGLAGVHRDLRLLRRPGLSVGCFS